jgi:general secretion pathway protein A
MDAVMYQEHFGLREMPFAIAPDPRFLFMSEQHRESLAHLLYGLENDVGFVLLTGEVGAGKTTICRYLLDQSPEDWVVAFIINPRVSVRELLSTMCDEFRIDYPKNTCSVKEYVDLINAYLLEIHAKGKKAVLIIDEAQNLSKAVLEQVRLLTNLETTKRKLLQIVLLGQPELRDKLAQPGLAQVDQRIVARYHLGPLGKGEIYEYVRHRLTIAGSRSEIFPRSALREIFRQSRGIPRLVNVLCDRALLGAFSQGQMLANKKTVLMAAREVFGSRSSKPGQAKNLTRTMVAAALIIIAMVPAGLYYFSGTGMHFPAIPHLRPAPRISITETAATPSGQTGVKTAQETSTAQTVSTPESARSGPEQTVSSSKPVASPKDEVRPAPEQTMPAAEQAASQHDAMPPSPEQAKPSTEAAASPQDAIPPGADKPELSGIKKIASFAQSHGQKAADSALFGWWGLSRMPDDSDESCRQARLHGLSCFSSWGRLEDLKMWNRPAVLKLIDEQGNVFYAAMAGMKERAALFALGDETVEIGTDEFSRYWKGEYSLLWPAPPWFNGELRKGQKGPKVAWLQLQLARLRGERTNSRPTADYSDEVAQAVRSFQNANGLKPDGIVGPQTLNRLLMLLDADSPMLTQTRQDL